MEQSKADSFTAYLKEKQRLRSMNEPPRQGGTPLSILNILADAPQQQMLVPELQTASGMSFAAFADSLKTLLDSRYLTVSGPAGSEVAALMALGVEVAGLARPR